MGNYLNGDTRRFEQLKELDFSEFTKIGTQKQIFAPTFLVENRTDKKVYSMFTLLLKEKDQQKTILEGLETMKNNKYNHLL